MFKYPNGTYYPNTKSTNLQKKHQKIQYGSRGMSLEDQLNLSNQYYLSQNIAVIHKKPTPIQVVKVDYPKRSAAKITEAYYRYASTTDYNGIYQGKYLDFEAKETKNKTRFPLANLPEHQLTHMRQCYEQGGIVFLLLSFAVHNEVYLIPYQAINTFINQHPQQSLPYTFIQEIGYLCPTGAFPLIDYLAAVDAYLNDIPLNIGG